MKRTCTLQRSGALDRAGTLKRTTALLGFLCVTLLLGFLCLALLLSFLRLALLRLLLSKLLILSLGYWSLRAHGTRDDKRRRHRKTLRSECNFSHEP